MTYDKRKGIKQKKDKIVATNRRNLIVRSLVLVSFLLALIIALEILPVVLSQRTFVGGTGYPQNEVIFETKGKYLEEVKVISWIEREYFSTTTVNVKGKIQLNFTVLPCSNASVFFDCGLGCRPSYNWTPLVPDNFTLAPGESFAEIYTLESGVDQIGGFAFEAYVFTEGSNATVRWWYKVLKRGISAELLFALRAGWWIFLLIGIPMVVLVVVGTIRIILYAKEKRRTKVV